jgi:hypothetical protein
MNLDTESFAEPTNMWTEIKKPNKKSSKKIDIVSIFNKDVKPNVTIIEEKKDTKIEDETAEPDGSTASVGSGNSNTIGDRQPKGITIILAPEWKNFVRRHLPNVRNETSESFSGSSKKPSYSGSSDSQIMTEINSLRNNKTIKLFDYKKIVAMMLHQAVKNDRYSLIEKLISSWTMSKFNLVELLESSYDKCKPMTQACWNGSISCIQLLVSSDPTGTILFTRNEEKNETILETLMTGRRYAIRNNPSNASYIEDRYDRCENFIKTALRNKAMKDIPDDIREEINEIGSATNVAEELALRIATMYMDDVERANTIFRAATICLDKAVIATAKDMLLNEGMSIEALL